MNSVPFASSGSDQDLWARQMDLRAEAAAILAELDVMTIVADAGPMLLPATPGTSGTTWLVAHGYPET